MQYVSCGKGHYYNPEEHTSCPQCAREITAQGGGFSIGATEPIGGYQDGSLGATEPVNGYQVGGFTPTEPVNGCQSGGLAPTEPANAPQGMGSYTPTEPVNGWHSGGAATQKIHSTQESVAGHVQGYDYTTFVGPEFTSSSFQQARIQPVVGWLVCVEGAAKGRDFRIHSQYNYIGRARHMDICIEGDSTISSERAAVLAYDDLQNLFSFAPVQGRNLVRVNGKAVLTAVELQAYDKLTIGKSVFLFIPLCGERFNWNEQEA